MGVLKYNSVRWTGDVDIENTVEIQRKQLSDNESAASAEKVVGQEKATDAATNETEDIRPRFSAEELLVERETQLIMRERELEQMREELSKLREQYIEQGKNVILEAKRRAEGLIRSAEQRSGEIISDAEQQRDDVFIKARAEGFEQGKKDGVAAAMAAGQDVLNEAHEFAERINTQKVELFERYEKEIFDTVMEIANKVTMNSMAVKDGTAAKKLIKKAAKEFRNSQRIRITLNSNGANAEIEGDYEFLKEVGGDTAHVEVELLPEAEEGTVIVDNGEEITDAGIQTQLKMIRELGKGKFRGGSIGRRTKKNADEPQDAEDFSDGDDE